MKPEIAVLDIQGQYRVYTQLHRAEGAEHTIILVNGSLATMASFAQTVRILQPQFNVVLYDQPYSGQSKAHNRNDRPLSKELEGQILLELINHFHADHLLSFSWGGTAALIALAQQPRRLKKAVLTSFSPIINDPMRDYLERGRAHMRLHSRLEVGNLLISTIGKHLPPLFKRFNQRHVSSLDHHEYDQMHFHINDVLSLNPDDYLNAARHIDVPVLFINGEWDEYTTGGGAQLFASVLPQSRFSSIGNAGHFLDMEHKDACQQTRQALSDFLLPQAPVNSESTRQQLRNHAAQAFAL